MSNRTLVELNHGLGPGRSSQALAEWAAKIASYLRSGDKSYLPGGVTFKHVRHHSDSDPIEAAPDLLKFVKLFKQSVEYGIRRSEEGGDTEDANLKRLTLNMINAAIARAEGV